MTYDRRYGIIKLAVKTETRKGIMEKEQNNIELSEANKDCIIQIMNQSPMLVAVKRYDE